jgi:hypothetical protein
MSRKHHEMSCCDYNKQGMFGLGGFGGFGKDNCCCSFPTLVILILIILQFSKKHSSGEKNVDNGILFIIALFFLACCNPCKK